jgi:hypothetical protein
MIVGPARALVTYPLAGTIRRSAHSAAAVRTAKRFEIEKIDGHSAPRYMGEPNCVGGAIRRAYFQGMANFREPDRVRRLR